MTSAIPQDKDAPLHDAASRGHTEVCVLLLGKGADLNAVNNVSDFQCSVVLVVCMFVCVRVKCLCCLNCMRLSRSQFLRRGGEGAGQWMKYYRCNFSWVVVMFLVCLFVGE